MKIDLSIIFQEPIIDRKVKLVILPLAPLSMVSDIPGTYYKTQEIPDKHKICGLFENILGWHFDKNDRIAIHKKLKEFYKKNLKLANYKITDAKSGFQPLLYDFFETGLVVKPYSIHYNDLWKKSFSRMDADVHAKGTPNLDYEILKTKQTSLREEPIADFFQRNKKKYPMFYTSPTFREYFAYNGVIQIGLDINFSLYQSLKEALLINSTAYLGNSEGWVEITIEDI